jgi:hypothetical protein
VAIHTERLLAGSQQPLGEEVSDHPAI